MRHSEFSKKGRYGITQAIRWAKEAGIPVVNAGDGRKPDATSAGDALKQMGDRFAEILEVAAKCQVYLAIEPHGTFSLTAEGLKKIMELSDSKWLGINCDTANVHRATYVETVAGAYSWTPHGQRQDEAATLKAVVGRWCPSAMDRSITSRPWRTRRTSGRMRTRTTPNR